MVRPKVETEMTLPAVSCMSPIPLNVKNIEFHLPYIFRHAEKVIHSLALGISKMFPTMGQQNGPGGGGSLFGCNFLRQNLLNNKQSIRVHGMAGRNAELDQERKGEDIVNLDTLGCTLTYMSFD